VREKCDLHIRAAGIFVMQLELLETQRLVALCHNEGASLDQEPVLATVHDNQIVRQYLLIRSSKWRRSDSCRLSP
jgi:hypothetical protein